MPAAKCATVVPHAERGNPRFRQAANDVAQDGHERVAGVEELLELRRVRFMPAY